MRAIRLVAVCVLLLFASSARAQTPPVMSVGSLTGTVQATIGIAAVKNPQSPPDQQERASVSLTDAASFFGKAECECDTKDVFMRLQISMGLEAGVQGNPTVWVGTAGCSNFTTRTTT